MASTREAAALKSAEFHCSAFDVPAHSHDSSRRSVKLIAGSGAS